MQFAAQDRLYVAVMIKNKVKKVYGVSTKNQLIFLIATFIQQLHKG
jgi:hypothetical protein